jgi:hypothetical protein
MSKREITINTVQGIGDSTWAYRKLVPHCDVVHYNILISNPNHQPQKRVQPFLKMLPKLGNCEFVYRDEEKYQELLNGLSYMPEDLYEKPFDYAVNGFLHRGIHLDEIDEKPVEWNLNLQYRDAFRYSQKYLLVYVNGCMNALGHNMTADEWARLIIGVTQMKKLINVIIIGAYFDAKKSEEVRQATYVLGRRLSVLNTCERLEPTADDCVSIIKHCEYFVCAESGLSMLAEELGKSMLFVGSPLPSIGLTWVRRQHLLNALVDRTTFGTSVEVILKYMETRQSGKWRW